MFYQKACLAFQSKRCSTFQDIVVHKKTLSLKTILRASHLISEVNIMLTQNSKGKASRDGQRLRHRGQGGDRYTGLGKVQGTKIQREFTDNQQKKTPNYQYLALCVYQLKWVLWNGGC
jgi:hypothetical protein